jgi:hypothetical protein
MKFLTARIFLEHVMLYVTHSVFWENSFFLECAREKLVFVPGVSCLMMSDMNKKVQRPRQG